MNNGKICVSICAENADELNRQIKRVEDLADIIEIRFDCLDDKQIPKAFVLLGSTKPLLLTYRPHEQGGKRQLNLPSRIAFWNAFANSGLFDKRKFWIDCELDLKVEIRNLKFQKIISFHDFSSVPADLENIFENLSDDSNIKKIAVQADDITDTISIWKLLEKAKSKNRQIIPIAMGEAGKWTRILGLANGAFMTYAALDSGSETAPGQVSAKDLIEIYRAKELDENTDVYGIIGGNTGYSMSPYIHNTAFKFHKLNSVFVPLQVKNLDEFTKKMVKPETREIELNFKGFAITIPHKQAIIKHLDYVDETAKKIGAVNTVKIENDKFSGYNTDAQGFIEPLKTAYGDLKNAKVAVFGAGGAARACVYALKKEGADVTIFARNIEKAKSLAEEFEVELKELPKTADQKSKTVFSTFDILVNTTPLGTKGERETQTPAIAEQIKDVRLVYDLVYNPLQTRFLREAESVNVPTIGGLAMLIAQASVQQKIWTNLEAPLKEMSRAALQKLTQL